MSAHLKIIACALGLVAASLAQAGAAERERFVFEPMRVTLPDDRRTFAGEGAEVVNDHCLVCHSAGMILVQPKMQRAAWEGIVHKMMNVFKAPVDEKDVPAIVDYLAALKPAQ